MEIQDDSKQWAEAHFGKAKLGDARRTARLVKLAASKADDMTSSIPEITVDSAAQEGAYRLLRNPEVEADAIIDAGCSRTAEIAATSEGPLLAIQDSTTLSYTHDVEGLGPLGGPDNSGRGIWVHTSLLYSVEDQQVVGVIEQSAWVRSFEKIRHTRAQRDYEDKESFRWEQTDLRMRQRLDDELCARTILVADREAESVELLGYLLSESRRFVLRGRANRTLVGGEKLQTPDLYKVLGQTTVSIQQRGNPNGRPARVTTVELRAGKATLKTESQRFPGQQTIHVIHVLETTPRKGKPAMEWWLLTSEPVDTLEQAWTVVQYYRCRWLIEDYHKAWKSGTQVEQLQFQHADNIRRYAAVLAFIAVRLLQLRQLANQYPDASAEVFFSPIQWKVLWLTEQKLWKKSKKRRKPPKKVPSIKWAHDTLARLGGFKDSKRTGRPGWDPLWDGYLDLEARVEGFLLALEAVGMEL